MNYISLNRHWHPIFEKLLVNWDKTLTYFEKIMTTEDLPYIYGERTNIGLLATAASKTGFITLEEYAVQKRHEKQDKPGRADLWLYNPKYQIDVSIEAKFRELSWNSKKIVEIIEPILSNAVKDVSRVVPAEGARYSLGVVFIRPKNANPEDYNPDDFWTQINDRSFLGADFCALHISKNEIWSQQEYNRGYPGIAMVGRFFRQ